uniref:NADH dehydrogenase subunit 6 n=1 Tax=Emerita talpoida TaxID=101207 RepID=UPI00220DD7CD|nr:NADH dehydrogenase subunit 6 [Emerita talpoida]UXL87270.1 NADH dehydrogenase subunit 6 [Emerita talpoida]
MLYMTLPMIILISMMFIRMSNPLSAGLTLLLQTIMIALSSGLVMKSFWFSYILFLIFLGGMLVLFIYVASLAPNESFKFSGKIVTSIFSVFLMMLLVIFSDPLFLSTKLEMASSSIPLTKINPSIAITSMIYNNMAAPTTMFIISYLLLALLVVVKIVTVSSKPLRTNK